MKPLAYLRVFGTLAALAAFVAVSCRAPLPLDSAKIAVEPLQPAKAPAKTTIFTTTREIRGLNVKNGVLWAATNGGVLRFENGKWTKWTTEVLSSHEIENIVAHEKGEAIAYTPRGDMVFRDGQWFVSIHKVQRPKLQWRNQEIAASLGGLKIGEKIVALPENSSGTHLSAFLPFDETNILAAMFGDGIWSFDGQNWKREFADLPKTAREITALAGNENTLYIGTRRDGIFRREHNTWTQFLQPNEPYNHNAQNITQFQNVLYVSTLEDGLMARTGNGWKRFSEPILSSNAPRHLVSFRDGLYVRHGGQMVDQFDGKFWTKNVFAKLPRKGIYALAADDKRLYAAAWGGWSEWDGQNWTHHFEIPELKGIPLMNLLPDGDNLWIGTQSRGAGLWNRKTDEFQWFDERHGLPDDWITALAKVNNTVYAGTFVGGLARFDGAKWWTFSELQGENVTALEADGQGGLWVATRRGLWRLDAAGKLEKPENLWLDEEIQALWAAPEGLWIGARTSIDFLRQLERN